MLQFYGYKKCSTCVKAEKFLAAQGLAYTFIDITTQPPSKAQFKAFFAQAGLDPKKFFNTSGEVYRELGLKDKLAGMSPDQMLELLSSQGRLVKRPLITDGQRVTVGALPDTLAQWSPT